MKKQTTIALTAAVLIALTAGAGLDAMAADRGQIIAEATQLGQEAGGIDDRWDVDLGTQDSIDDITTTQYLVLLLLAHVNHIGYLPG